MNKKIAILALALCMIAAIAVTGTIAYFTDTDNQSNVFTLGKGVSVNLYEMQLDEDHKLTNKMDEEGKEFDFGKILPAVYGDAPSDSEPNAGDLGNTGYQLEMPELPATKDETVRYFNVWSNNVGNKVDKFVFVQNTGDNDVYFRTIFAVSEGFFATYTDENGEEHDVFSMSMVNPGSLTGGNHVATYLWSSSWESAAKDKLPSFTDEDGTKYYIITATYVRNNEGQGGKLRAEVKAMDGTVGGEISAPSLEQVLMVSGVDVEDVYEIDENGNMTSKLGKLEIKVATQAVQTDGMEVLAGEGVVLPEAALNAAFGAITSTNHPWAE